MMRTLNTLLVGKSYKISNILNRDLTAKEDESYAQRIGMSGFLYGYAKPGCPLILMYDKQSKDVIGHDMLLTSLITDIYYFHDNIFVSTENSVYILLCLEQSDKAV